MHEFGLVMKISEIIINEAKKKKAKKVTSITITLGENSGVMSSSLAFAMDTAFKKTILEGAEIIIEEIRTIIFCPDCGKEFHSPDMDMRCKHCSGTKTVLKNGNEFKIKEFTMI